MGCTGGVFGPIFVIMEPEMTNNSIFRLRQRLQGAQERDFDRYEKIIREVLKQEDKISFPIPAYVPQILVFLFILIFPMLYIWDPVTRSAIDLDWRKLMNFYFPVLMCIGVFGLNLHFLVPNCILKKHYVVYFVCNSILVLATCFLREVVFFLIDRAPGQGVRFFLESYMFSSVKGHFSYWTVFSFVVLVCLVCVICVFYRLISTQILRGFVVREQKRSRLQYELEFLKNQLSPHFLFNTLNNITALIAIDSRRAEKSMMELSKLLRVTLYQTADDMIPLEEDVEILRMYGNLEKLRLDDSFDYRFDVELENPKVMIPPLVAMPLVENALKHSKNPKGKSFAHITIRQQGDELVMQTENSNFPKVSKSSQKASGLGLSTFQKRLEILYAGRYEYTASADGDVYRSRLKIQLADN